MATNDRSHPSASSERLHADASGQGDRSGFGLFVRDLRTRRVFSPAAAVPAETGEIGTHPYPPAVGNDKADENAKKADTVDDSVQSTPPEAVEVSDLTSCEWPGNAAGSVQNTSGSVATQNASKPALRTRGRVFKAPGSFSYRRLLPYLTDFAKEEDSSNSHGIMQACRSLKLEKGIREKLPQEVPDSILLDESGQANPHMLSGQSPAIEMQIPSGPMKGPYPENVTCPASENGLFCESGTSGEDGNVIADASMHDQSRDCSDDVKVEVEANQVCPVDSKHDDTKASFEKQTCSRSCDPRINSPNISQLNPDTAENSAFCPASKACMVISPDGTVGKIKTSSPEKGERSPGKRKRVSNSCVRSKHYRISTSFSYQRLLPYLKKIEKNDSCTMTNSYPQKPSDSDSKEFHLTPLSLHSRQIPADVREEQSPMAPMQEGEDRSDESSGKSLQDKSLLSSEKDMINEVGTKIHEVDNLNLEAPPVNGTSAHVGIPCMNSNRGILKRNPRGCRGICPCLNCASFRLHAQRAFEFSRNQMEDTEELALDLMKEMSNLRNLLERISGSATAPDSLVVEACRNASAVEAVAKDRLKQMNEELNIHCRIKDLHRPSVMFGELSPEEHSK